MPGSPTGPCCSWHCLLPGTLCLEPCPGSSAHDKSPRLPRRPGRQPCALRRGRGGWRPSQGSATAVGAQPGGGGVCIVKCEPLAGGWPCVGHAGGWALHTCVSAGPKACVPVPVSCLSVCTPVSLPLGLPLRLLPHSVAPQAPILGPPWAPGRVGPGSCLATRAQSSQQRSLTQWPWAGQPGGQARVGRQGRAPGPPVLGLARSLRY